MGKQPTSIGRVWWAAGLAWFAPALGAATFGEVITIGGQAADIALDEARGVLYAANFTAGRIEVLNLSDHSLRASIRVLPQPSALALSPDGRFLLVAHYVNFEKPETRNNALTVFDWKTDTRAIVPLESAPLGAAFGNDGVALVATAAAFLFYNPYSGRTGLIGKIEDVTATALPVAPGKAPAEIVSASLAPSGDGEYVFGLTDKFRFIYETGSKRIRSVYSTASPALGPRVTSAARDGGYWAAGWGVFDHDGRLLAQFANPAGLPAYGSHAIDTAGGTIYAEIPQAPADGSVATSATIGAPVLSVADADNLTVRERLKLPEHLTGRALLNASGDTLYAISESGLTVLKVGALQRARRIAADREDLTFQANACRRGPIAREFALADPGGGSTAFSLSADLPGVTITPSSGRTPAVITVRLDPLALQNRPGTVFGKLRIDSAEAVNIAPEVRLVANLEPAGGRGVMVNVPGILVDVAADPVRDRFYVLRQDRNLALVFDGTSLEEIAALRTSNTPTSLAITPDGKHLLIGHRNSQQAYVYDLERLERTAPAMLPHGHYPQSLAASGSAVLAASRVSTGRYSIVRIDMASRGAAAYASLGPFANELPAETVLAGTANGNSIMAVSADGNLLLYDAGADAFTISRKLNAPVGGAYAASGFGQYAAGNHLLNAALGPAGTIEAPDLASGFAFIDRGAVRLSGQASGSGPGLLERIDLSTGERISPTRIAEQPAATAGSAFSRTVAPLANRNGIVLLTASGFTVAPWKFETRPAEPRIDRVASAADLTPSVAPGSLVTVFGSGLDMREPGSCLMVNGAPAPVLSSSAVMLQAQLPYWAAGNATLTFHSPGGASNDFPLAVQPVAPAIFRNGSAGPMTGLAAVIRVVNGELATPSNPIHPGDRIVIYAAGLGTTLPAVEAGVPAPAAPGVRTVVAPEVRLGDVELPVTWAGLVPGEIGIYSIQAQAPGRVPAGMSVPLTVAQGGATASVDVRVVE